MAQPYVGEVRIFAGNFAPSGWMFCEGQLLAISDYETLFNLIGTTYGGDGQNTFGLPDMRGRLPVHMGTLSGGQTYTLAQTGGAESVSLTTNQIPSHAHGLGASSSAGSSASPSGTVLGKTGATQPYRGASPAVAMSASSISTAGGSQPHSNMQPYLCLDFIISLFGIFPSQN